MRSTGRIRTPSVVVSAANVRATASTRPAGASAASTTPGRPFFIVQGVAQASTAPTSSATSIARATSWPGQSSRFDSRSTIASPLARASTPAGAVLRSRRTESGTEPAPDVAPSGVASFAAGASGSGTAAPIASARSASSPSVIRSAFGRSGQRAVPIPTPTRRGAKAGALPTSASTARSAAPVGVTASPGGPPGRTSTPRRISSTAGGGTGRRPWAVFTKPCPSSGGAQTTRGQRRRSSTTAAPHTSTIESTAPTSWKWTSSTETPCTFASASPIRRNTAAAASFARGGSALRSTSARMSDSARWCGCGPSTTTSTCVPRTPPSSAVVTSRRKPGTSSPASARSSRSRGTPRSSAAARNMSPAMPPMGSRYRISGMSRGFTPSRSSPATNPAPKPLSTFTTVTFGAQEFSIARSAERPPIDAP